MRPTRNAPHRLHRRRNGSRRSSPSTRRRVLGLLPSSTSSPAGSSRSTSTRSTPSPCANRIKTSSSSPSSARSRSSSTSTSMRGVRTCSALTATTTAKGAASRTSSGRRRASAASRPSAASPAYAPTFGDGERVIPSAWADPLQPAPEPSRATRAPHLRDALSAPRAPVSE